MAAVSRTHKLKNVKKN